MSMRKKKSPMILCPFIFISDEMFGVRGSRISRLSFGKFFHIIAKMDFLSNKMRFIKIIVDYSGIDCIFRLYYDLYDYLL